MIKWPDTLIKDIARRHSVIYLGSGVSKNSVNKIGEHPKTWKEFLLFAINQAELPKATVSLIKKRINYGDLLLACEILRDELGRDQYNLLLKKEFQHKKYEPAEIHRSIFRLDSRIVVSPNFDQIYETYSKSETEGSILVKNYYDEDLADAVRSDERIVIKLHGAIDTPDKMIFSQMDYAKARNEYQSFYQILNALITTHTFLFIGAGLNDPDIKLLLENYAFQYHWSRRHYFVIPKNQLSTQERKLYSKSLNLNWLLYDSSDNHKELTDSCKDLVGLVENERDVISKSQSW